MSFAKVASGRLAEGDWTSVAEAVHRLTSIDLHICDDVHVSQAELCGMVRLMTEQKESCMVVLDGIEIANGLANVHAGHSGVRERTVELKRLAREFDIPVLMTVDYSPGCRHIARDYEGVFKALPSGVEGLADTIIHIGRSLAQIGKSRTLSSEIAEIVIAKSGKNAPMAARLAFLADCQRFVDYVDL